MASTDHNKPTGKSGGRNRKAEQRNQESDQKVTPKSDKKKMAAKPQRQPDPEETFAATAEPTNVAAFSAEDEPAGETLISAAIGPTGLATVPSTGAQAVQSDAGSMTESVGSDLAPVGLQTIANAYGDYTRKSLEQTRSYFDRLARVRSLEKAVEVQVEFAKQAYQTFVSEMQKICGLQTELARQSFRPWEGFMAQSNREAHQSLNGSGTRH
ncbi:MAG TPA: phasin family protein [Candidatus Dormibacteraeota bacterium]|nr:phasin family protein [Candidatus Dormibacteraeota bacterium]